MERLTTNKNVLEMTMVELAHNSCFAKDRNATYRDYEEEFEARDFIRRIGTLFGFFEEGCAELLDDEFFDETMFDYLQYGYDTKEGLIALFYRNLWAMADLREKLKYYEDLEKQGLLLKLPCKVGDYIWDNDFGKPCSYEVTGFSFGNLNEDYCEDEVTVFNQVVVYYTNYNGSITGKFTVSEIGKTVFLAREEAEEALRKMNEMEG